MGGFPLRFRLSLSHSAVSGEVVRRLRPQLALDFEHQQGQGHPVLCTILYS